MANKKCSWCGKPTDSDFCSDNCKKKMERAYKQSCELDDDKFYKCLHCGQTFYGRDAVSSGIAANDACPSFLECGGAGLDVDIVEVISGLDEPMSIDEQYRKSLVRPVEKGYISKRTWKEFQECGLVWWINRGLHLFGWAIVLEQDSNGKILEVYPARCRFRGFCRSVEEQGFRRLSQYIHGVSQQLIEDSELEALSPDDESEDIDPLVG